MSIGTIVGILVGLALFLYNIFFGAAPPSSFWDSPDFGQDGSGHIQEIDLSVVK